MMGLLFYSLFLLVVFIINITLIMIWLKNRRDFDNSTSVIEGKIIKIESDLDASKHNKKVTIEYEFENKKYLYYPAKTSSDDYVGKTIKLYCKLDNPEEVIDEKSRFSPILLSVTLIALTSILIIFACLIGAFLN